MEIEDYSNHLDSDDVARQRYGMFKIFENLLDLYFEEKTDRPVEKLSKEEGYLYKLSQDFLTSSSTFEKRQKLEKMAEFLDVSLPD